MKALTNEQIDSLLANVAKRRAILEAGIMGVVNGFSPALFIWGSPGMGKSHALAAVLDSAVPRGWRHHTGTCTPLGLMRIISDDPCGLHVFEDCEPMLVKEHTASILRAACGAPNDRDRWVTHETANVKVKVKFTGGILIATNANLARNNGPMQGVASRFRPIRWELSVDERVAVMMLIARSPQIKNGVHLTAAEVKRVAVELIDMALDSRTDMQLDIRLLTEHGLPAFAQAKQNPGIDWSELLMAKLQGVAQTRDENQAERSNRLRAIALKIFKDTSHQPERLRLWKDMTGLGKAIFYRHLKEAKRNEHGQK